MPLSFNMLLSSAGLDPEQVSLLRHQDLRARRGRSIYQLWRDDRAGFEDYQSRQRRSARLKFKRPIWASFVAAPNGETLFAGLYRIGQPAPSSTAWRTPLSGEVVAAGADNVFPFERLDALSEYIGLIVIDWGEGARSWVQRADRRDKPVLELRRAFQEQPFPGYGCFFAQLSALEALPATWRTALSANRGIYLLTCPRTGEHYVGAAVGGDGFLGRWSQYASSGHGGNVALKNRDPSDYRVAILEVAASSASIDDILALEALWKAMLQTREMGLNRN